MKILKKLLVLATCLGLIACGALAYWYVQLDKKIVEGIKNGWFPPAVAIYSKPYVLKEGQAFNLSLIHI